MPDEEPPVPEAVLTRRSTPSIIASERYEVTVSGLSDGIAAMSMSANRTGDPAVTLQLSLDINASRSSGSSGWSGRNSTANAKAIGADTPNGSVRVGKLTVHTRGWEIDPNASATNTVTFGLDWVVDENGIPYAIPGNRTVTVHVTDRQKATGKSHTGRSGTASASGSVSS